MGDRAEPPSPLTAVALSIEAPDVPTDATPKVEALRNAKRAYENKLPVLKKQWTALLAAAPTFDAQSRAKALQLCRLGCPPSTRGVIWYRAIGNSLCMNQALYSTCLSRAASSIAAMTTISDTTSIDSGSDVDADVDADDVAPPMIGVTVAASKAPSRDLRLLQTEAGRRAARILLGAMLRHRAAAKRAAIEADALVRPVTAALREAHLLSSPGRKAAIPQSKGRVVRVDSDDDDTIDDFKDVVASPPSVASASSSGATADVGFQPNPSSPYQQHQRYSQQQQQQQSNYSYHLNSLAEQSPFMTHLVAHSHSLTEDLPSAASFNNGNLAIQQSKRTLFDPKPMPGVASPSSPPSSRADIVNATAPPASSPAVDRPGEVPGSERVARLRLQTIDSDDSDDEHEQHHGDRNSPFGDVEETRARFADDVHSDGNRASSTTANDAVDGTSPPPPASTGWNGVLGALFGWRTRTNSSKDVKADGESATPDLSIVSAVRAPAPAPAPLASSFVSTTRSMTVHARSSLNLTSHQTSITDLSTDLDRTFPDYQAFFAPGTYAREQLQRVLSAYAFFRPDHGYVQGMSHVAAILILTIGSLAPNEDDLRMLAESKKHRVTSAEEEEVHSWRSGATARAKQAADEQAAELAAAAAAEAAAKSEAGASPVKQQSSSWFGLFSSATPKPTSPSDASSAVDGAGSVSVFVPFGEGDVYVPSGSSSSSDGVGGKSKRQLQASTRSIGGASLDDDVIAAATSLPPLPSELLVFTAFTNIMARAPLRWLAARDVGKMEQWYELFSSVLTRSAPKAAAYLAELGVTPNLYLVSWLLTLFSKPLGLEASARLWDVCLVGGHPEVVKCAVGLVKHLEQRMLGKPFERVMRILASVPKELQNPFAILDAAQSVKLTVSDVIKLTAMEADT